MNHPHTYTTSGWPVQRPLPRRRPPGRSLTARLRTKVVQVARSRTYLGRRAISLASGSWRTAWPAYGASLWATLFALQAAYWALGGTAGLGTLPDRLQVLAMQRDPRTVASVWALAGLLAGGAALALLLTRPRKLRLPIRLRGIGGNEIPGWWLLVPAVVTSLLLLLRGSSHLSVLVLGDLSLPATRWYGLFWGPWFLLGGGLYALASFRFRQSVTGASDSGRRMEENLTATGGGCEGTLV